MKRRVLNWKWHIALVVLFPICSLLLLTLYKAANINGSILIGLVLIGVGIFFFVRKSKVLKHGYITDGKVIEIISERGSEGTVAHFPIIRFKDSENIERDLKLGFGSNLTLFHLGQVIKIAYYKGEIHLAESEWKILYLLIVSVGIGIIIFQILT